MGCDLRLRQRLCARRVSIHAPTWGATDLLVQQGKLTKVSIHAPTWGATYSSFKVYPSILFQSTHPHGVRHRRSKFFFSIYSFNPRTHMGCDLALGFVGLGSSVSIHAPTWGATYITIFIVLASGFQSTHPHGVRLCNVKHKILIICFNPRTHMGCDCSCALLFALCYSFNPRTHMGCDYACA